MKKQFVTYPIAISLKELGFNEPCLAEYDLDDNNHSIELIERLETTSINSIKVLTAPLWQQVIDWFREKHQININPLIDHNGVYYWVISRPINSYEVETEDINGESWEIARETAILKAIEIIKKQIINEKM